MNKQLDILFKDQKKSEKTNDYNRMMSAIDENIRKVRNVGNKGETAGKQYILRREYEYEYYKILKFQDNEKNESNCKKTERNNWHYFQKFTIES